MHAQRFDQCFWQHRYPVLLALAVTHKDLAVRQIHVLHPQPQALDHAQPRPVEQACQQPARTFHRGQQAFDFLGFQRRRQAWRARGPLDAVEPPSS
jgi:hypothetical protein